MSLLNETIEKEEKETDTMIISLSVKLKKVHIKFMDNFEEVVFYANKYFSNAINFSLKTDGPFSHSGDVDPVMDKFIQNLNGIFELKSIK